MSDAGKYLVLLYALGSTGSGDALVELAIDGTGTGVFHGQFSGSALNGQQIVTLAANNVLTLVNRTGDTFTVHSFGNGAVTASLIVIKLSD